MNAWKWDHTALWIATGWCAWHFCARPIIGAIFGLH